METETQNYNFKYLPIGSVVLLKEAKKRVMIIGYKPITEEKTENGSKEVEWDYSGCIYPEGMLSSDQILLFNHSQIQDIYFIGFIDAEAVDFRKTLNNFQ